MIDLKELNILLEKSELQSQRIREKLESNVEILSDICIKSQNWKDNTSVLIQQSRDVEIALDIALGVDKAIREQITRLTDNYNEEEVEKYITQVFNAMELKNSGIGKNQREKDLYQELQQAIQ